MITRRTRHNSGYNELANISYAKVFTFACLRVIPIGVSFLVTWLIVRAFTQAEAGNYLYVFSIIGLVSTLASLGLNQVLIRSFGANGIVSSSNETLARALIWVFAFASILVTVLYLGKDLIATRLLDKPVIASILAAQLLAVFGLAISSLFAYAFQGVERPTPTLIFLGLGCNVFFVLALLTYYWISRGTPDIVIVSWLFSASAILSAILAACLWFTQQNTKIGKTRFRDGELYASAFPLWISQIIGLGIKHGGLLISGIFISSADIAKLGVSLRTAELLGLFFIAVTLFVSPRYAKLWVLNEHKEIFKLANNNVKFLLLLSVISVSAMIYFDELILSVFGAEYRDAARLLTILAIGQAIYICMATATTILNMTGHEREMMYCAIISGSISIPLTIFLVVNYSVVGAALSSALSLIILGMLSVFTVRLRLGSWIW